MTSVADRFDLLVECAAIDQELTRLEALFGAQHPAIQDARLRQQRISRAVMLQVVRLWMTTEMTH
jgi:hypothetical protein